MREDQLDQLCAPAGRALLAELAGEDVRGARALALAERLRARYPADLVAAALTLTELRTRARAKFTRADRMWFTRQGLEQATAEVVARHRARRFAGLPRLADLCCGVGGDLAALAPLAPVLAVDLDPVHLRMARCNAAVYGAGEAVQPWQGDAREADLGGVAAVFVDPARRTGDRRHPWRSSPPLEWCLALAGRVPAVAVKAAPGLPLELVPAGWEAELVSEGRELKEATLWSPALATAARRATLLPAGHTLVAEPGPPVPVAPPGAWVLDPDPAVTRAGLVEELARAVGAWKLDERVAFLSADRPPATPFGRLLRVEASLPWSAKRLRAALRAAGAGAVDIRKRGSAVDVERLRRQLDLSGDRRLTVLLTLVRSRPWALVCADA